MYSAEGKIYWMLSFCSTNPDPAWCETPSLHLRLFADVPILHVGAKVTRRVYFSNALATTMDWALSCMVFDPTAGLAARSRPA